MKRSFHSVVVDIGIGGFEEGLFDGRPGGLKDWVWFCLALFGLVWTTTLNVDHFAARRYLFHAYKAV